MRSKALHIWLELCKQKVTSLRLHCTLCYNIGLSSGACDYLSHLSAEYWWTPLHHTVWYCILAGIGRSSIDIHFSWYSVNKSMTLAQCYSNTLSIFYHHLLGNATPKLLQIIYYFPNVCSDLMLFCRALSPWTTDYWQSTIIPKSVDQYAPTVDFTVNVKGSVENQLKY